MITVRSVALTAALFGQASVASAQTGCYPSYSASGIFAEGDQVSAAVQEEEDQTVSCNPTSTGCNSNGEKVVQRTVTNYYNFACHTPIWCNSGDRAPGGQYSNTAWSQGSECDKSAAAVTNAPPAQWSGEGCPKTYSSGTDYESGDVVTVEGPFYKLVYQCVDGANSAWCGDSGYEPGTSIYWTTSWTELGSCDGTISPTNSPSWEVIENAGGCPEEYADGGDYDAGDRVSLDGLFVFTCKPFPNSGYCGLPGYRPMKEDGHPDAWKDAWEITGYCSGSISPTASPSFVSLEDLGACPDEWTVSGGDGDGYEEGDRVSHAELVFACKGWPMGAHCPQAGYEPDITCATCYWKEAWQLVGHCNGSMGPTASPSFDFVDRLGRCPDAWMQGDQTTYEEGDLVAVTISEEPLREVVYKCKAWPYSGHCGQYAPDAFGGNLGWTLEGSCDGSMGPTSSPSFDSLEIDGGCPAEYSTSTTDYEAGDEVSVQVSDDPIRAIKYRCRTWPNTGYCNQAGFRPGVSTYDYMGWELVGACSGSFAPTESPSTYAATGGTCTYIACDTGTYQIPCTPGSTGCCSASSSGPCTKAVSNICDPDPAPTNVNVWSSGGNYEEGDVVRLGRKRFKCRPHPNEGWCTNSAYKPTTMDSGLWTQAWTRDGECP